MCGRKLRRNFVFVYSYSHLANRDYCGVHFDQFSSAVRTMAHVTNSPLPSAQAYLNALSQPKANILTSNLSSKRLLDKKWRKWLMPETATKLDEKVRVEVA